MMEQYILITYNNDRKVKFVKLFASSFTRFIIVRDFRLFIGFLGTVVCMHFLMDLKMSIKSK